MEERRSRVLVAVDGSEHMVKTLRYVGKTVASRPADVALFHVTVSVPGSFIDVDKEPVYRYKLIETEAWEMQQKERIETLLNLAQATLVTEGVPIGAIERHVRQRKEDVAGDIAEESLRGYDAVVVGRRGLSSLKDLVLGSIADKLVNKLGHVPIWIVDTDRQRGKFLVALDTSEGSMHAVEHYANYLAHSPRFEVVLLHVIKDTSGFDTTGEFSAQVSGGLAAEISEAVAQAFARARECLRAAGMDENRITETVVEGPSVATQIVEAADREGCDTILLGRRGLSRLKNILLGSVSTKVLHLARDKAVWIVA